MNPPGEQRTAAPVVFSLKFFTDRFGKPLGPPPEIFDVLVTWMVCGQHLLAGVAQTTHDLDDIFELLLDGRPFLRPLEDAAH